MNIEYKNKEYERVCTQYQYAVKKYGKNQADKIHQRIDELKAAFSVDMLVQFKIGRCHQLTSDRNGQFAMDLVQPYRLVFEKKNTDIQTVRIIEIVDYH